MAFLTKVLGRPKNERPFIMVPVGYPLAGGKLPDINRKPIDQALVLVDGS